MSLLDELSPDELAAAQATVARLRAEQDVLAAGGDLGGGFAIDRPTPAPELGSPKSRSRVDELLAEQDAADGEDFTAFWHGRNRRGAILRNVVPGVNVELPPELPLAFEVEARRLANDESLAAVHHLFAMLYGTGTLDQLIGGGLTGEQLGVLILWGAANGSGRVMSLADATAEFERMKAAKAAGKALPRPSGSGGTSAGTGGASRPTSRASTGSKKKKSRR